MGKVLSGNSSSGSGTNTDLGTTVSGVQLNKDVTGLNLTKEYKWRARVQYNLVNNPFQKLGPWKYYNNYVPTPQGNFRASDGQVTTLNLTILIQGFYYAPVNVMVQDTLVVYLRNGSTPYAVVDSAKTFLSPLGTGILQFQFGVNNVPYYIEVKHRNSIETWSDSARKFVNYSLTYNFTTSPAKAFGSNQIQIDASPLRFGIYSGDVNQDGAVELSDGTFIDNDAFNFASGYIATDVNGDGFVDVSDLTIADNNGYNYVIKVTP